MYGHTRGAARRRWLPYSAAKASSSFPLERAGSAFSALRHLTGFASFAVNAERTVSRMMGCRLLQVRPFAQQCVVAKTLPFPRAC